MGFSLYGLALPERCLKSPHCVEGIITAIISPFLLSPSLQEIVVKMKSFLSKKI